MSSFLTAYVFILSYIRRNVCFRLREFGMERWLLIDGWLFLSREALAGCNIIYVKISVANIRVNILSAERTSRYGRPIIVECIGFH